MSRIIGEIHKTFVFSRRTRVLAAHIGAVLPAEGDALDVGCGDGTIDAMILAERPGLTLRGVDVFKRPATHIPVDVFDGTILPFPDKSFDAVMFVDVLHHTDDPMVLLREARRVARDRIVLKDHTQDGPMAGARLRFMDWVGNAHHGVVLPYNYWSERRWRASFKELDLRVVDWTTRLGLYPFPVSMIFEAHLHFIAALKVS